jgi:hypothetical protein
MEARMINDAMVQGLKAYIKEHYVLRGDYPLANDFKPFPFDTQKQGIMPSLDKLSSEMGGYIKKRRSSETFAVLLDKLREEKGLTPAQLYEGAWIDRRLYSKIMGNRYYHPVKNTVIALGLSLKLSMSEMEELLGSAGFVLNNSSIFDLAIMFCLDNRIFDIYDVNVLLLEADQKVLCRE